MIGVTLQQPAASAAAYGIELGAGWPTEWPLQPKAVGQYIAIHASTGWTREHAARAAQLGVTDCPRGQIVGVGRVAGWSRLAAEGPTWLGDPDGPSWARQGDVFDRRALIDRWPLCVESAAVFFDDAIPLTASTLGLDDDAELVCFGNAKAPWPVPERVVRALRSRWGSRPAASATTGRPSGSGPAPRRCSKPPSADAQATADALADLLPDGWSTRLDDATVGIIDPTGRCRKALLGRHGRQALADILVRVVMRFGAGSVDEAVGYIRRRCPWVKIEERAA